MLLFDDDDPRIVSKVDTVMGYIVAIAVGGIIGWILATYWG